MPQKGKKCHKWTLEDDARVRREYPSCIARSLARDIGVSRGALMARAQHLGVVKAPGTRLWGPKGSLSAVTYRPHTGYLYAFFHGSDGCRGCIPYHRWLMEQHLGRKLLRTEDVHHKNGIPLDNRLENLEVVSHSDHTKTTQPWVNRPRASARKNKK